MKNNRSSLFSLKRALFLLMLVFVCILVASLIFFWFLNSGVRSIRDAAQNDPAGAAFFEIYTVGAINYEQSSTEKLFLEEVAGSNSLELVIDLSQQPTAYELRCSQVTTGVEYYNLKGTADEVIEKIKAKDCFDQGGNVYILRPDIQEKY